MATRSRIGIENEDGTVSSIYCHWDGYPDHNGKILVAHYSDREKLKELIDLGAISSLRKNLINTSGTHSFESPQEDVTVAYHRDRGEDLQEARIDESIKAYAESDYEEYGYVFTKYSEWKVVDGTIKSVLDILNGEGEGEE
jgi:hypothetical protein